MIGKRSRGIGLIVCRAAKVDESQSTGQSSRLLRWFRRDGDGWDG